MQAEELVLKQRVQAAQEQLQAVQEQLTAAQEELQVAQEQLQAALDVLREFQQKAHAEEEASRGAEGQPARGRIDSAAPRDAELDVAGEETRVVGASKKPAFQKQQAKKKAKKEAKRQRVGRSNLHGDTTDDSSSSFCCFRAS